MCILAIKPRLRRTPTGQVGSPRNGSHRRSRQGLSDHQATFASHPDPAGYRSCVVNLIEILNITSPADCTLRIRIDPDRLRVSVVPQLGSDLCLFTPRFGPRKINKRTRLLPNRNSQCSLILNSLWHAQLITAPEELLDFWNVRGGERIEGAREATRQWGLAYRQPLAPYKVHTGSQKIRIFFLLILKASKKHKI